MVVVESVQSAPPSLTALLAVKVLPPTASEAVSLVV